MNHHYLAMAVVACPAIFCPAPARAATQTSVVPPDGMFFVESRPAFRFKATLVERWRSPHAGDGSLRVYAPVLPELPGQSELSTCLTVSESLRTRSEKLIEHGVGNRPMLGLNVRSDRVSLKSGISLLLECEGVLHARQLKPGKPPKAAHPLRKHDREKYLAASATMDYTDSGVVRWLAERRLNRQRGEEIGAFGHRVFTFLAKNGTYGGDTSGYESRRPSRVWRSLASDCGGFSLLFVAIMRANRVPARALFGRWAIPQTDKYGQYHVIAEFFVAKSGWVPVDIAGTIVHKPKDPNALFGNTDGQFLAFHIDTDVEPARGFNHAWAQYLLLHWSGEGDFWKEHRSESQWNVQRKEE